MPTTSEALAIARAYHEAGRLDVALEIYRRILAVEPDNPGALHLLGYAAHQAGDYTTAVHDIGRAIAFKPLCAEFHNDLGVVWMAQGNLAEAIACYRRAVELKPDFTSAYSNLGNALRLQGNLVEAATCCERALRLNPDLAEAHSNLGLALKDLEKVEQAVHCFQRALQLKPERANFHYNLGTALRLLARPDDAIAAYKLALQFNPGFTEACVNLGNLLADLGRFAEAIAWYQKALQLDPTIPRVYHNLGTALNDLGKPDEAIAYYKRALYLDPTFVEAHNDLGRSYEVQGRLDEAVASYRRAVDLRPSFAEGHLNLGNALKDQGAVNEAIACYRRAIEINPKFAGAHSNLLYVLHFCPDHTPPSIYGECLRWNVEHAAPLTSLVEPHTNDRSPDRRLRIGYVSPDLREHPVGRFLLPLLDAHDHQQFEIFCYSSVCLPDAITARCRTRADAWRDSLALSDDQLSHAIRQDGIDILVDLTMHLVNNRLLVFASKPAPVQVTYLAYCGTTGLETIDYRFTDPYFDPPGQDELFYSEESVRLPETYWCYRPVVGTLPVNVLPAPSAGRITFGCLNNFCKVSEPALTAWSQLLTAIPRSRLLLHANSGTHRERARELLAQQGVSPERVSFVDFLPTAEYFKTYQQIDVALDPFPYGGGATTCDALWMGVPVVSLAGQTAVGRAGLSILSNVGLPELVARDTEEYVRIATGLANDLPRLANLRATLRERMQKSPLMDAPRFARNVEAAYRWMWHRWCER